MNSVEIGVVEKNRVGAQKALQTRAEGATFCPTRHILDQIGDKWSLLAILNLGSTEHLRFNELRKRIGGVSQRVLTVSLRSLEADGLANRTVYPEVPPRVEYRLTALGHELLQIVLELDRWANQKFSAMPAANREFDAATPHKT